MKEMKDCTLLIVGIAIIIGTMLYKNCEAFTAPGWVLTHPPNWFLPKEYEMTQWLTPYTPDQLSENVCLSYNRGNNKDLNYLSSAYRLWRF